MMPLLASLSVMAVIGGVFLVVNGVRRAPEAHPKPARRRRSGSGGPLVDAFVGTGRVAKRNRILLVAGLLTGVVVALVSGWLVAILILPVAFVGVPTLLGSGAGKHDIARIEAMEEWTRSLAGVLGAGVGLEQAIQATLSRSTPAPIRTEVATLVARLRARWTTAAALRAFADDLDDATGDAIVAGLLLAADRRGNGLSMMLERTAERASEDVRNRRRVEADLAKPRTTARWVTVITIAVLGLMAFNGTYIAPYGSGIGQLILIMLLGLYVGALMWMQRMSRGERIPRLLGTQNAQPGAPARGPRVVGVAS